MSESAFDWRSELTGMMPRLRRYALSLTRNPDVADDMVQSTLERALSKRHLYKPGTNFDGWMFRICRNLWIDEIRKKKFDAGPMEPEMVERMMTFDGERQMAERALLANVSAAMAKLSEDQRSVLLLVGVEGHSYAEASEMLEIPVGTVMSRLARARQNLSQQIFKTEENQQESGQNEDEGNENDDF